MTLAQTKIDDEINVTLVDKDLVKAEIVEKEIINVKLSIIDILMGNSTIARRVRESYIVNEIPTHIENLKYRVTNNYSSGTLQVFLNGLKEKNITELSSTEFEFKTGVSVTEDDTIEVAYLRSF